MAIIKSQNPSNYFILLYFLTNEINYRLKKRFCKVSLYYQLKSSLQKIKFHHHHVVPLARISLTLPRHFSLSGSSSELHLVYSHSCCMYVRAGRPAFARPYVGVYRSTSLMSSSLLLRQCSACMVHLTWIVFEIGGKWPYSWCLVGCCRQDLFNIALNILV